MSEKKRIDLTLFHELCKRRHLFIHGLVIKQNDQILTDERYIEDVPHELNSVTKSITSLAVGIAQDHGLLSLEDKIGSYFPEYADINDIAARARIRDFLMMAAGRSAYYPDAHSPDCDEEDWVHYFLSRTRDKDPGTFFVYESAATNTISAIIQKATGMPLPDFVQQNLFDAMHIPYPRWDRMSNGIAMGGAGLHLRTGDLAKIGDLLLHKGIWNSQQLVSEEYIKLATSKLIDTDNLPRVKDNSCGYGLGFWQNSTEGYRADGYNGQYIIVLEKRNAVITMNSYSAGFGDVKQQLSIDTIWDSLLNQL